MSKISDAVNVVREQIAKLEAKLADLLKQEAAALLVEHVAAGFIVKFKIGRADTRREVQGEVLGRGEVKGVDSVRVSVGEGLEAQLFTVPVAQLTDIITDKADAVEAVGDPGVTAAAGADADLLADVLG